MPFATLTSPILLAVLLVPGWGLAAVILFIGGVPGEWARTALTVWTALAAALLAGGAATDGAPLALLVLGVGFGAMMTGGPWGLAVAALAAALLVVVPLAGPRWPAILLALPAAIAALRQILGR